MRRYSSCRAGRDADSFLGGGEEGLPMVRDYKVLEEVGSAVRRNESCKRSPSLVVQSVVGSGLCLHRLAWNGCPVRFKSTTSAINRLTALGSRSTWIVAFAAWLPIASIRY